MNHMQTLIDDGQITEPSSPRGRLLDEAAHLFRIKGYERTTVRDIADAVGIQSGSIFHHFKTKEDILKAVMTETIIYNNAKMRSSVDTESSAQEKLLACIRCELESIITSETVEAMSVLVSEWRCLSEENQQDILIHRDHYEACWMESLTSAKKEGLIEGDLGILRRLITGAINWTTNWYNPDGDLSLEDLAQEVLLLACKSPTKPKKSTSPKKKPKKKKAER